MSHRIFTDSKGVAWLVLAVYPTAEERRYRRERRAEQTPIPVNRRQRSDRRKIVRRSMEHGWLVFKAEGTRRRMTPIVDGWENCSVEDLEKLLAEATQARRVTDPTPPTK